LGCDLYVQTHALCIAYLKVCNINHIYFLEMRVGWLVGWEAMHVGRSLTAGGHYISDILINEETSRFMSSLLKIYLKCIFTQ